MARDFPEADQQTPTRISVGYTTLQGLELTCPNCRMKTYIPGRTTRLARTGSRPECARCAYCAVTLAGGRVITYPTSWHTRFYFWRHIRQPATVIV